MKTIEVTLYKFNELSADAQQKAIEWYRNLGNCSEDVWSDIKEDAKEIGLKILSLDDHKANKGGFLEDSNYCANKILENHGESCETYKTAKTFLDDWSKLVSKYSDGENLEKVAEDNEWEFDQEADDLEAEFLHSLLEDYRVMYNKDVEYQESAEAIKEMIEINEYDFTEDGERY